MTATYLFGRHSLAHNRGFGTVRTLKCLVWIRIRRQEKGMDSHNLPCLDCLFQFLSLWFHTDSYSLYTNVLISEPSLLSCMCATCLSPPGVDVLTLNMVHLPELPPCVCFPLICAALVESGLSPSLKLEYWYTPVWRNRPLSRLPSPYWNF